MSADELKLILSQPLALFAIMLLASLGSAMKQLIVARREKPELSLLQYFTKNLPETVIMLMHNAFAFGTLIMTDSLNWAAALGIGYLANDAADVWTREGRSIAIGTPADKNNQAGFVRPLMLAVLLAISVVAAFGVTGCATLEQHQTSAKLTVQYATFKVIERGNTPAEQARKAENIRRIATDVKALASGESVTIDVLQVAVNKELAKLNLSAADRFLANALVQALAEEVASRVGAGLIAPDQLVQVNQVLDWVISAAEMASPPA